MRYETQERMYLFHLQPLVREEGVQSSLSQECSALDLQQRYLAPSPLNGEGWDGRSVEEEGIWEYGGARPH